MFRLDQFALSGNRYKVRLVLSLLGVEHELVAGATSEWPACPAGESADGIGWRRHERGAKAPVGGGTKMNADDASCLGDPMLPRALSGDR